MFIRLLHGLLGRRIAQSVNLNIRQKAFIPVDGCGQNTLLVDAVVKEARRSRSQLSLEGIDLSKAFDTVSIHFIRRRLRPVSYTHLTLPTKA